MSKLRMFSAVALTATLLAAGTGCAYLGARDNLNKGIAAYKGADYASAVEYFKEAIALDPDWIDPQLYLATAYMNQWIPGARSPENLQYAEQAKDQFHKVLDADPNNISALAYLAMIAYNEASPLPMEEKLAKLEEAAEWHQKRIAVDPNQADAYYSLGVIAYQHVFPIWTQTRADLGMRTEDPGPLPDEEARESFREQSEATINEGLANLEQALEIDPEYDDAMAYINLLLRQKADLLADEEAYAAMIAEADDWLQKNLDTKRIKAERASKAASTGITQEQP